MDVLKERIIEVATLCACVCMSQAKPNGIVGLEYFKNPKVLISKRHPVSLSANCLGAVWGKTFLYFTRFHRDMQSTGICNVRARASFLRY